MLGLSLEFSLDVGMEVCGCAMDDEEDKCGQELISRGWTILGVSESRHEVSGAFGDAVKLVLRCTFGIHRPQLYTQTHIL